MELPVYILGGWTFVASAYEEPTEECRVGAWWLVFLSRLRVVVFPFLSFSLSFSSDSTAVREVSERSVSANELASVSPGLPSGSKPEVLDISAAAAADELRPR